MYLLCDTQQRGGVFCSIVALEINRSIEWLTDRTTDWLIKSPYTTKKSHTNFSYSNHMRYTFRRIEWFWNARRCDVSSFIYDRVKFCLINKFYCFPLSRMMGIVIVMVMLMIMMMALMIIITMFEMVMAMVMWMWLFVAHCMPSVVHLFIMCNVLLVTE